MTIGLAFVIFLFSIFLITKTTDMFVKGAVSVAYELKVPKSFIGITLVSLMTTLPELIVSITGSIMGESGLVVGNALGSCICNIGLVFAVAIIINDVKIEKRDKLNIFYYCLSLIIAYLLFIDYRLSRIDGIILLLLLIIFQIYNYYSSVKRGLQDTVPVEEIDNRLHLNKGILWLLIGGLTTVLIARYGIINTGIYIANRLKVPSIVIGLTLVALGTSIPELFTAIISSRSKNSEIAFGNVLGANILNILFILGIAVVIKPIPIDRQTIIVHSPVAFILAVILYFLSFKRYTLKRRDGIIILIIYVLYIIYLFSIGYY